MKKNHKVKGFTLIELIIVIAIFGIIMAGALNMFQPSRTLFNKSFSEESMVSGATQINKYLEESLKYANAVRITENKPDDAALKALVNDVYRDKLIVKDKNGNVEPAKGHIYVLEVNNLPDSKDNTGVIRKWSYSYTAGGHFKDDGSAKNPEITAGPDKGEYAVNAAAYNDFNYTISLGIFERKNVVYPKGATSGTNVYCTDVNSTFYDYNSTNPFSFSNFGFTVTAYPKRLTGSEKAAFDDFGITNPRFDYDGGVYGYTNCGVYANGFQFENYWNYRTNTAQEYQYIGYKINSANDKKQQKDGKDVLEKKTVAATARFQCYASAPQMNPEHFYIIYTYNEGEILAS